MWLAIFGSVILAFLLGVIYLTARIRRMKLFDRIAGGKPVFAWLLSAAALGLLVLILTLTMDLLNAVICILHLILIWLLCDLIGWILRRCSKNRIRLSERAVGAGAILLTFLWLASGWYLAHHVARTAYTFETGKDVGTLRIVQITDSHIGATFHADRFAEYLARMQAENPDLVVITGDFVDDGTSREDMIAACKAFSELKPTYGVYFVYGNHDKGYYSEESRGWTNTELAENLRENGVVILEDQRVLIDDRIWLIGRRDLSENLRGNRRADMAELTEGLGSDKYVIVLDHQPGDYDAQAASGADLVLSGHTHGGQLIPITYVGEWIGVNCRTYGTEKRENTDFLVSSGIGDWAIYFKTGCKSEYVVIDVLSKDDK